MKKLMLLLLALAGASANASIVKADFGTSAGLPYCAVCAPFNVGPKTFTATGQAVGAGNELGAGAVASNPSGWDGGEVWIDWSLDGGSLNLRWKERNGPGVVSPSRRGFGSTLIERGTVTTAQDHTVLAFEPDGVRCEIGLSLGQRQN